MPKDLRRQRAFIIYASVLMLLMMQSKVAFFATSVEWLLLVVHLPSLRWFWPRVKPLMQSVIVATSFHLGFQDYSCGTSILLKAKCIQRRSPGIAHCVTTGSMA